MSEAIILGAIRKLETVLVENPTINTHHEWVLKEIISELRTMLAFLKDEESRERTRLSYLLADFAEMAQVIADLTRDFGHYFYYFEDKKSLDLLRKMKMRMMEFGVGEAVSGSQSAGEEGVVVGLEKDVQQLIGRVILNENTGLVTSCIKGMLGVGKTALARQVYNHPAIVGKFKHRAWISISSYTSVKEVLVELIQQLVELDGDSLLAEEMDNRSLQKMLLQHLQGKTYFIVLDNLLPEMRLQSILDGLPDKGHGSRLLFTSRYQIRTAYVYYTHEMKVLDSDKSWKLFLKTIDKFTSVENNFSKELERKGKEMLKKCGGLPIAIIDVARQKAKQRLSGIEWEELFDSVDLSESLKLLEPMYNSLDEQLKSCFLHMSLFKENAIMRNEKLEQIWAISGLDTRSDVTIT
ncbi:disease resistance protein RPP13-like, partial [Salvia hispanica]|uniref:disease resistance protein RPP13-like n=1 Tax=Salvia hispanica TaxID=49212 RepID=UPI002009A04E